MIKSLIIPKFVYISSLLLIPKGVIKDMDQWKFKFLWKGVDKVTFLSTINDFKQFENDSPGNHDKIFKVSMA